MMLLMTHSLKTWKLIKISSLSKKNSLLKLLFNHQKNAKRLKTVKFLVLVTKINRLNKTCLHLSQKRRKKVKTLRCSKNQPSRMKLLMKYPNKSSLSQSKWINKSWKRTLKSFRCSKILFLDLCLTLMTNLHARNPTGCARHPTRLRCMKCCWDQKKNLTLQRARRHHPSYGNTSVS